MTTESPFIDWLKSQCTKRKLSYRALARGTGYTPASITYVLNGKQSPSDAFVEKVIRLFSLKGDEADEIKCLAEISSERITFEPVDLETAKAIAAFKQELIKSHKLKRKKDDTETAADLSH